MKYKAKEDKSNAVILLPLHPVSLMHKNSVRCKIIIHGMHGPCVGHKDRSIDLKMWKICIWILGHKGLSKNESKNFLARQFLTY